MKTTGVIRRIDELGRIVIPKEIRRNLGIRDGENIEIFTDDNSIILKKHSRIVNFSEIIEKVADLTKNIMDFNVIITDREKVVLALGDNLNELSNMLISSDLINFIDLRESNLENQECIYKFGNKEIKGFFAISPIISSNDSVGLVIIYNQNKLTHAELKYSKFFATLIGEKIDIS